VLPKKMGRITNLRLSGSDTRETDRYLPDYLTQPGVRGSYDHVTKTWTLSTVYDAPQKLWRIPIGNNQFTQNLTSTHDTQTFALDSTPDYERWTRDQNYAWYQHHRDLEAVGHHPGILLEPHRAKGNTHLCGPEELRRAVHPMQKRIQPKAGVMYRNFLGLTQSSHYTGNNLTDYSSSTGRVSPTPTTSTTRVLQSGSFMKWARKINLNMDGGRTEGRQRDGAEPRPQTTIDLRGQMGAFAA
jgi:hypothetical protein